MKNRIKATPKFLLIMCIVYGLFVIGQSIQVIYTPSTLVKVVNLIAIVFLSGVIGAFIREIFILKKEVVTN
ncbi:hypothetical protein [Paenisporosarcina sp. NPDC076898]|uniref:hypothetical protein n=1 Tax=unclassified Paenisporosarcina TaxID=2642018 RepID=UPI003D04F6E0